MSNIKIQDVFQRIQYSATNGQTQFSIPFPFFSNSYVTVWQDGIVITQGGGAGEYGISGAGSPSGGLITLVTPATLDSIITIEGIMPIDRTSIYSATISNLTGSDLNGDFNREVVMMKQIQTTQALLQLQYAPWAEISQDETVTTDRYIPLLPPLGAWRMNAGGTAIETFLTPTSGTLAPGDATYILQTADADLPNAQAMGALATGLVVNTTTTGVQLTRLLAGVTNQTAITNASGLAGNPTVGIATNPTLPGTEYFKPPAGTTAQRPGSPTNGMVRFNSDLFAIEVYAGSAWDALSGGVVDSVSGFANQIEVDNTDPINPIIKLPSVLNVPGTFNIQSTTAINAIINDSTLATATTSNIATAAALKTYIDSLVTGLNIQGSCVCASTTALTVTYANGTAGVGATLTNAGAFAAISLDGVSPTVGQRVLIKNQASSLQNGIYTVTTAGDGVSVNWVLTRATDYDTPSEVQPGDLVVLTGGTTQTQSSWLETATVADVGTDAITFVQFTASLPVTVPNGGTGATSFTAYAPIVGGTTTTGALQSVGLGAAGTLFQSAGVGALPGFTTTTYPSTNAINTIMYASSANVLGSIAAANSSVMVSSAGGVPSFSTTLPTGLTIPGYALTSGVVSSITGTANQVIASASTGAVTLSLPQSIATTSDVTFGSVTFSPTTKGIVGTPTNNNAASGYVGEYLSTLVPTASSVSLTSTVAANIATISLTAGDWDVWGQLTFDPAAGTLMTLQSAGINKTSATISIVPTDDVSTATYYYSSSASNGATLTIAPARISIASTTTVYLVARTFFSVSTCNAYGKICARRVR